jgi:hypothetical protein
MNQLATYLIKLPQDLVNEDKKGFEAHFRLEMNLDHASSNTIAETIVKNVASIDHYKYKCV